MSDQELLAQWGYETWAEYFEVEWQEFINREQKEVHI